MHLSLSGKNRSAADENQYYRYPDHVSISGLVSFLGCVLRTHQSRNRIRTMVTLYRA